MPSLISDAEKLVYESVRDDIFDTFARQIFLNLTPDKIIISTTGNYFESYNNPDYQDDTNLVTYTPKTTGIMACVSYDKTLEKYFSNKNGTEDESLRLIYDAGMVRVKIKSGDYPLFKNTINYKFDGYNFSLQRMERPHGLFDPKYYTLYLSKDN